MAKLRHNDYRILVELAMDTRKLSSDYIQKPEYLNFPEVVPLEAEEMSEYFISAYEVHKGDNPDFPVMLNKAVYLFLDETSIISLSKTDEATLKRSLELFNQKYEVPESEPDVPDLKKVKGEISLKQQLLLLDKLGLLQNARLGQLTVKNKAILLSKILRRDPSSTEQHLANFRKPVEKPSSRYEVRVSDENTVNKLLKELGF